MRTIEDAEVDFLMHSEVNWRNVANSIIANLLRVQVQQANAGILGLFGLGGGSSGASESFGLTGNEFHRGGIVGINGTPRSVHPAYFENAPRMHLGGLAGDEVPAILQRGERVIPRGGSAGLVIHIQQNIGGNVTRADLAATAEAARRGTMAAIAEERRRDPAGAFGG
jgi:hypothetical protein